MPLDHARSQSEVAPLLKGLRASGALPTLDAGPMVNLTEGCIRPPGAEHRLGGFQRLVTPLNQAAATLVHRTTPAAWEALLTQLPTAEVTRVDLARLLDAVPAAAEVATAATGGPARPLAPYFTTIAVTGQYDTDRYGSPSQARAAVVLHAVGRGWTELELRRELDAGHWPGLARLYSDKYGTSYSDTALFGRGKHLKGDLGRAIDFIHEHPLHRSLTSAPRPRRGATDSVDLHLRKWTAALNLALAERRWEPALGYGRELVLVALADAARRTRRREVEHGTRHLSMNAGTVLNPSTVASHLRALRTEDDPFVLLLDSDRGAGADVYELVIPARYAGQLPPDPELPAVPRGVHPVFGRLSKPSYRLYTALQAVEGSTSAAELAGGGPHAHPDRLGRPERAQHPPTRHQTRRRTVASRPTQPRPRRPSAWHPGPPTRSGHQLATRTRRLAHHPRPTRTRTPLAQSRRLARRPSPHQDPAQSRAIRPRRRTRGCSTTDT